MKTFLLTCLLAITALCVKAAEPLELKLWGGNVPGKMVPPSAATQGIIRAQAGKGVLTNIHEPTITLYRPAKPNGASVIVAPGGGFAFLSLAYEGRLVCEWLNSLGIAAVLLKYRTPTRDDPGPQDKPVQDALRAIVMVRENAQAWRLDPQRVGLLGLGSGGGVVAHVACDRAWQNERPNFGIMVHADGFVDPKDPTRLAEGFNVSVDAPPLFLADAHHPASAVPLYLGYAERGIPAELHLFAKGGDDSGLRTPGPPVNDWPQRCAQWMDDMGWLLSVSRLDTQIAKLRERLNKLQPILAQRFCGNDGREELAKRVKADKAALLKAELANDKPQVDNIKRNIAQTEDVIKLIEEGLNELRQIHEEGGNLTTEIAKLENERGQILRTLAVWQEP